MLCASPRQVTYAGDIARVLHIPLPKENSMSVYASYIADHLEEYYHAMRRDEPVENANQIQPLDGVELRLVKTEQAFPDTPIESDAGAVAFLQKYLKDLTVECLVVLNLNNAGQPINYSRIAVGNINMIQVSIANIFKTALLSNAAKIILCHNHVSGFCDPSEEDKELTANTAKAGRLLNLPLLDHIIICQDPNKYYSFLAEQPKLLTGKLSFSKAAFQEK